MPTEISQQDQFGYLPATTRRTSRTVLNLHARAPFVWRAHPERWQIIGEGLELLPLLGTIKQEPGLNGVMANGDDTITRAASGKEGWIVLEWDSFPELGPTGYCRAVQGLNGPVHFSVFETPKQTGKRVRWAKQREGQRGFVKFLRSLLVRELIPEPTPEYIESLIEDKQQVLDRLAVKDMRIKKHKGSYEREIEKLAALELALERVNAGESVLNPEPSEVEA